MTTAKEIIIYTDGASRGNPGPGGFGTILMFGQHRKELSGGYRLTTNNRMELMAVIEGLKALKTRELPVKIYSDSRYIIDSITKGWLTNWIRTDFKGGKKNRDLWMEYHRLAKNLSISMVWVKGHADNAFNNRCDQLATAAANGTDLKTDIGFEKEGLF